MNSTDNPGEPENLIAVAIDAAEEIRDSLDRLEAPPPILARRSRPTHWSVSRH